VNAELAGLVEKLRKARESAAFREIVRSGSLSELSAEQRKRVQEYRRTQPDAPARES